MFEHSTQDTELESVEGEDGIEPISPAAVVYIQSIVY